MAVADRPGLPIAICTESARQHEVKLVMQTLAKTFVAEPVQPLIGDNGAWLLRYTPLAVFAPVAESLLRRRGWLAYYHDIGVDTAAEHSECLSVRRPVEHASIA